MTTPEEFAAAMREIYPLSESGLTYDAEMAHVNADELMKKVLREMGYAGGLEAFDNATVWYA